LSILYRYVSVIVQCPYSGRVEPRAVADVADALLGMGCYEVSLGDTIGVASAREIEAVLRECTRRAPIEKFAAHFHDTYGQALPNILTALNLGVLHQCCLQHALCRREEATNTPRTPRFAVRIRNSHYFAPVFDTYA
jgi:isopropylmalate/homocitrate/citramalate synthase